MLRWLTVVATVVVWSALLVAGALAFVYSGAYDIGADAHHTRLVSRLIGELRERSVDARLAGIAIPDLDDPQRIAEGAEHYDAMCTGCHLAPDRADSELREGLYPRPPNLTRFSPQPREAFWIIKHGIKMSGMPAWGLTHDDDKIWAMVAFLQKLPDLTPEQYRAIVPGPGGENHAHDHDHEHAPDVDMQGEGTAPAMTMPPRDGHGHDTHAHEATKPDHA